MRGGFTLRSGRTLRPAIYMMLVLAATRGIAQFRVGVQGGADGIRASGLDEQNVGWFLNQYWAQRLWWLDAQSNQLFSLSYDKAASELWTQLAGGLDLPVVRAGHTWIAGSSILALSDSGHGNLYLAALAGISAIARSRDISVLPEDNHRSGPGFLATARYLHSIPYPFQNFDAQAYAPLLSQADVLALEAGPTFFFRYRRYQYEPGLNVRENWLVPGLRFALGSLRPVADPWYYPERFVFPYLRYKISAGADYASYRAGLGLPEQAYRDAALILWLQPCVQLGVWSGLGLEPGLVLEQTWPRGADHGQEAFHAQGYLALYHVGRLGPGLAVSRLRCSLPGFSSSDRRAAVFKLDLGMVFVPRAHEEERPSWPPRLPLTMLSGSLPASAVAPPQIPVSLTGLLYR